MSEKRLLSIFLLGSELRQFSHSGLFAQLLQAGWQINVLSKIDDPELRDQLDPIISFEPMPVVKIGLLSTWLSIALDKAHALRRLREGKSSWKYGVTNVKNWKEKLLATSQDWFARLLSHSAPAARLFARVEKWLIHRSDRSLWRQYLRQQNISAVLVNLPRQSYWDGLLATAEEMGIATYLVYHTWKDVTAAGRLNHHWSGIGVWNSGMKTSLLAQNPWLDAGSVKIVGCGHFDCIGRPDWLPDEAAYRASIGARPYSALILYPTSGPGIIPEEERYIHQVVQALSVAEKRLGRPLQIVFRMNPMDDNSGLEDRLRGLYPEHIVLHPDWVYIRKKNWCYGRKVDTIAYNALLMYASACVCIPSTVTVDSAIVDLPVINLGIEAEGKQPLAGSLRAFWDAEFYHNVRETHAAEWVTTVDELAVRLVAVINDRSINREQRKALVQLEIDGILPGQSSERTCAMINGQAQ